jgi:hypothetical protein
MEVERIAEALLAKGKLSTDELKEIIARQPRLALVHVDADVKQAQ